MKIRIETNINDFIELGKLILKQSKELKETIDKFNNFELKVTSSKLEAPEVEAQELSNQICNGQKTLNQAREELGLEPLEECDKLFTTAQCCKKCED